MKRYLYALASAYMARYTTAIDPTIYTIRHNVTNLPVHNYNRSL